MKHKKIALNKVSLARGVALFQVLFLSLFALDVFVEGYSLKQLVLGLFIHLLPSLLLLGALIISWSKPRLGGMVLLFLGLFSISFFHTLKNPVTFIIVTLPPILSGLLFIQSTRK